MVKVTGKWFSFANYGTAMGVVSLSYLFGDAAARSERIGDHRAGGGHAVEVLQA